jgi:high-affinity iron transporter
LVLVMLGFLKLLPRAAVCIALLLLATVASATESDVRRIWQILDYVAVDYRGAVKDGAVLSTSEFAEMREFAKASQAKLAALDPHPEQPALMTEAGALAAAIDAREDPARVATLARSLGNHLLAVYPVSSSPSAPPNVAAAAVIYQAQCAACHGAAGKGDGPLGIRLEPRPVAFTDQARARERSVFAMYQVISQGIEGTPMVSFASLPEADRWALAFYIGQFAHKQDDVAAGEKVWKDNTAVRAQLTNLDGLARTTEADLGKEIGDGPAAAAMAFLHAHPEAVVQNRPLSFDVARQRLAQSEEAYGKKDFKRATDLALSAYLDGVEPLEPTLATRDKALLGRIETAMSQYRSLITTEASASDLKAQAVRIDALFKEADGLLSTGAEDPAAAFLGSFTILLREGLEALLVVVAMLAFLRKAERVDMLGYVHAGWVAALVLGAATWAVATYIVNVSGASREVTEGLSSLFAAAVLLSVGMWMHQKSMAGKWQQYIHEKLSAALNRKSAFFMFSLSFIAVYREVFETILFYAALWEQGNHAAVLGGLVAGLVVLIAVAFALLKFSARLPIGKFFSWSSMLVAVLAVVLTGKGVAALQEAGWIGAHAINTPRIEILGVFPSAQALGAQLVVAAIIVLGFAMNARAARGAS